MQSPIRQASGPHLKSSTEDEYFFTATIGKPVGIHGALRVHSVSGEYDHLISLTTVCLQLSASNDAREYQVLSWEKKQNGYTLRLVGVDSPEEAKKLVNARILVLRDQAAQLRTGEVYIRDLLGCVVYRAHEAYGVVRAVYDLGAYDCLEIEKQSGESLMIPLQDVFIESITEDRVVLRDHELFT